MLPLYRKLQLVTQQQARRRRLGRGSVGQENLGNICNLNSNLLVLLYIDYLCLCPIFGTSMNVHGFKGRLASSFGRLVGDLYSAENRSSISPKQLSPPLPL
jgi:hypothetical protein